VLTPALLPQLCNLQVADIQEKRRLLLLGIINEMHKSAQNATPAFGMCPLISARLRFYLPVRQVTLFAKIGLTYLLGTAIFDSGIPNKRFRKIGTLIGAGLEKNYGKYDVEFEITKILPASTNIGTIRILNDNIQEKVKLSRIEAVLRFSVNI
jgi:hypothetical protein